MIGTTVSHYRILEKLGEGGMGVVYKAQDTKLDRTVALKFLPQNITPTDAEKKRFIHEAKAASSLDHPNICTVFEIDETPDGQMFLAMAFYEGAPLSGKIKLGPVKIDEALEMAIQAAEGLQAAHEKGIIHRDIKSGNLMLTEKGQVKIMDFGLARRTGMSQLTKTGATVGTVPYMSPEQARGEKLDHRTDIWSVGVVLYEMIAGRLPFQSAYSEAIVYSILNEEPPPLTSLRSDVPMELERIVNKCLAKNANERYQSLSDMLVDLRKLRKDLETEVSKVRLTQMGVPIRNRRVLYGAGLALVALAFVIAYFFPSSKSISTERKSIAVLPFKNLSDMREDEYFSDGITEDILTQISKIGNLRVISGTSTMQYKNTQKNLRQIGKELGVATILEGSVRRAGTRVRIVGQLIDTGTDEHLWAETYDRDVQDIFSIQSEVAQRVAEALKVRLLAGNRPEHQRKPVANLEAYDNYLRGRFYRNVPNNAANDSAIKLFERAITLDPQFALAHAALARAYIARYFIYDPNPQFEERAFIGIQKALLYDSTLADAYLARSQLIWTLSNKFPHERAVQDVRRALELNPNLQEAHFHIGYIYLHIGLLDEALEALKTSVALDPNDKAGPPRIARIHWYQGKYEQALAEFEQVQGWESEKATLLCYLGRKDEALALLEKVSKGGFDFHGAARVAGAEALVLATLGRFKEAEQKIKLAIESDQRLSHFHHTEYFIACAYALMGKRNQAIHWLQRTADDGHPCYPLFEKDPNLKTLRDNPQFVAFMERQKKQWEYFRANL